MTGLSLLLLAQTILAVPLQLPEVPQDRVVVSVQARVSAQIVQAERIDFATQSKRVRSGDTERFLVEFD